MIFWNKSMRKKRCGEENHKMQQQHDGLYSVFLRGERGALQLQCRSFLSNLILLDSASALNRNVLSERKSNTFAQLQNGFRPSSLSDCHFLILSPSSRRFFFGVIYHSMILGWFVVLATHTDYCDLCLFVFCIFHTSRLTFSDSMSKCSAV